MVDIALIDVNRRPTTSSWSTHAHLAVPQRAPRHASTFELRTRCELNIDRYDAVLDGCMYCRSRLYEEHGDCGCRRRVRRAVPDEFLAMRAQLLTHGIEYSHHRGTVLSVR
jgi:hypothetical protein